MQEVGLQEVRQNASELVRRAQAGERLTVSGRPAASLGPVEVASSVSWEVVADVFVGPGDTAPASSPSIPSVRFTAFVPPQKMAMTTST